MSRRDGTPSDLYSAASEGDRRALARLLSLVERGGAPSREVGALAYRSGREAATVGITGAPGSGKSTLVDRLVAAVRAEGGDVGVLAVDPSSPFSGGAILGDRVRMQEHALDEGVFIRSMASRGHLGGLAVAVPEALRVLAAAGLPLVLVETVGVGQVEVEVASATDTTVVVVNPRWGDSIQANKAGLLEVADVFVVNKADNPGADETRRDLEQMLDLSAEAGWRPPVVATVATSDDGIGTLWGEVRRHQAYLAADGSLERRRRDRLAREFRAVLSARMARDVEHTLGEGGLGALVEDVVEHRLDPYAAADTVMDAISNRPPTHRQRPPDGGDPPTAEP